MHSPTLSPLHHPGGRRTIDSMGSDFLFAMPSVLSGEARSLDLGATFDSYNESVNEQLADAKALSSDWWSIGRALLGAMNSADCTLATSSSELVSAVGEPAK